MRLGLCCRFRDQPIKFVTTTVAAVSKMTRRDALAKLSRLCLENADALLASLQFCAANGIGCFRINSRILPIKTRLTIYPKAMRSFVGSRNADNTSGSTSCGHAFTRISSWS
jgi:UV DNA damage repair endonuclease